MRSLLTSYSWYYNRKYGFRGSLFESVYKVKRVTLDAYLLHITRYILMNPIRWKDYPYSSLKDYVETPRAIVKTKRILELFHSNKKSLKETYFSFLTDYESYKSERDLIKYLTAE